MEEVETACCRSQLIRAGQTPWSVDRSPAANDWVVQSGLAPSRDKINAKHLVISRHLSLAVSAEAANTCVFRL